MTLGFDDRQYTMESIVKQAVLMELHSKDGSAIEADCGCIEGKHCIAMEALAEEGIGFGKSEKEKRFYDYVANVAREIRKHIEFQDWSIPGSGHSCPPCPPCEKHECPPCEGKT